MNEPEFDWTDVADSWDARRADVEDISSELTDRLLHLVALRPGERVLELAGGTGDLAARLSELVRPGGSLVTSDVAAGMVDLIERRTSADPDVQVRRIDACAIDCASDGFDAVVMRMGLMLVPDPVVAAREIRRVLRPGGRFCGAVWGSPQQNLWMAAVGMAATMTGLMTGPPPFAPGGPFSLQDPAALGALLRNAGFDEAEVTTVDYVRRYPTTDALFDMVRLLAPPIAAAFASATPQQIAAARDTVGTLTADYRDGEALELPVQALVVLAR